MSGGDTSFAVDRYGHFDCAYCGSVVGYFVVFECASVQVVAGLAGQGTSVGVAVG